jgi:hypothetical protein
MSTVVSVMDAAYIATYESSGLWTPEERAKMIATLNTAVAEFSKPCPPSDEPMKDGLQHKAGEMMFVIYNNELDATVVPRFEGLGFKLLPKDKEKIRLSCIKEKPKEIRGLWHATERCDHCLALEAPGQKLQRCGECRMARYCGKSCQLAAWKEVSGHKVRCFGRMEKLLAEARQAEEDGSGPTRLDEMIAAKNAEFENWGR